MYVACNELFAIQKSNVSLLLHEFVYGFIEVYRDLFFTLRRGYAIRDGRI
jgi:hypothetical protein